MKAKDRERTLRTLVGTVTLTRNYHYCERCQLGFYPVDRTLALPEEGELTAELEKRALDLAITDVYGDCAQRWLVHYRQPVSQTLFRNVVSRVGALCESADQQRLQAELKPAPEKPADDLIRYYRTNAQRMRYALFREASFPIVSGAAESAHRHVLQVPMKRSGQFWATRNARRMASLRAAFRTAGPLDFYPAIHRARARDRTSTHYWRRGHFRYAREGTRERNRCLAASSN